MEFRDFKTGTAADSPCFPVAEFLTWSEAASFPLLPSDNAARVFAKIRRSPSLGARVGNWRARPLQGDFNATADKGLFILDERDAPKTAWPVLKGGSFDLWELDSGPYYAWADPADVLTVLQERRVRSHRNSRSPFSEFGTD